MTPLKVAAFTPGPPDRTGGAVYAGALLPELARNVEIVTFAPQVIEWGGEHRDVDEFRPGEFDVAMHFLGNNPSHAFAYCSGVRWGGVMVLHDSAMSETLWVVAEPAAEGELALLVGPEAAERYRLRRHQGRTLLSHTCIVPGLGRPLAAAELVIVHNRHARLGVEAQVADVPVRVIPMHASRVPEDLAESRVLRGRHGVPRDAFVVGLFGYIAHHKRIPQALAAVARARSELRGSGVELLLVIVGTELGTEPIGDQLRAHGLERCATVAGFVDDRSFIDWLQLSDVVLNLRFPTAGESSLVAMQAMALGKPVILSDYAQFGEERAAVRVPLGDGEVEATSAALITLGRSPSCREQVAALARARADAARVDVVAREYAQALEEAVVRRSGRAAASCVIRTTPSG